MSKCPVCNKNTYRFQQSFDSQGEKMELWSCGTCGFRYTGSSDNSLKEQAEEYRRVQIRLARRIITQVSRRSPGRNPWIRKCDDLWSEIVKARYNYICQWCGKRAKKRGLHAHHIFTKAKASAARYEVDNGVPLCANCHLVEIKRHSKEFRILIIKSLGEIRYLELEMLALEVAKRTDDDYRAIYEQLKRQRSELLIGFA